MNSPVRATWVSCTAADSRCHSVRPLNYVWKCSLDGHLEDRDQGPTLLPLVLSRTLRRVKNKHAYCITCFWPSITSRLTVGALSTGRVTDVKRRELLKRHQIVVVKIEFELQLFSPVNFPFQITSTMDEGDRHYWKSESDSKSSHSIRWAFNFSCYGRVYNLTVIVWDLM